MRAVSLLAVLLSARLVVWLECGGELTFWTPLAYGWHDLLLVLAYAAMDAWIRRPWVGWLVYGLIVAYEALNLPLTLLMSSPLTPALWRAARGPLADSIQHHLAWENLRWIAWLLAMAVLVPMAMHRIFGSRSAVLANNRWRILALPALGLAVVLAGSAAVRRVDTGGLHRNAISALVTGWVPRLRAEFSAGDWRSSPFASAPRAEGFEELRGAAAGYHVLLVALESTGAAHLKPCGGALDPMPALTLLAERAILFEQAYAVYPESIKGLFSVFCSRYPAFDTPPELYGGVRTPSLAQRFAAAGYRTALFHSGRFMYLGMEEIVQGRGFETLEDAGDISGRHNSSFGVDEPATVARLFEWIDSLEYRDRFFATYLPIAGHHPYDSPEPRPFPGDTDQAAYLNALHYGDRALAQLLEGLRVRGLDQKTMLVIYGDHGEAFGEHPGNFGHTLYVYEENVRVPLLFVVPGRVNRPLRAPGVASLIDLAPTLLDLAGLEIPPEFQGSSLLSGDPRMALFFTDYSLGLLGVRDGRWKFILELESGRGKLFDLDRDQAERIDLAGAFPAQAEVYARHLRRWGATQRALVLEEARREPPRSVAVRARAAPPLSAPAKTP